MLARGRKGTSGAIVVGVLLFLLIVGVGGYYAYTQGYLSNFGILGGIAPTTAISGSPCSGGPQALALAIFSQYNQNAANANAQYLGKTICIEGEVYNVQQDSGGNYESCVYTDSTTPTYACDSIGSGGWVVWKWANQATAQRVYASPSNPTPFVAQCTIGGLQSSDLILNNCVVEVSPYSS